MRRIILDALCLTEKKEAHLYLQKQFSFPEYYGNNLDSLFDCLTDFGETLVHIKNGKMLVVTLIEYLEYLKMLPE